MIDLRLDRLADIKDRLVILYSELADLTSELKALEARTWFEYGSDLEPPPSATQRDRAVKYEVYVPDDEGSALGREILRREAEVKGLVEERDLIRLLLTYDR